MHANFQLRKIRCIVIWKGIDIIHETIFLATHTFTNFELVQTWSLWIWLFPKMFKMEEKLDNQRERTSWNLNSQRCDRYTCFARTKCIVIHWIVELCFVCYLYVSVLIYVFTVHVNPFFLEFILKEKQKWFNFVNFCSSFLFAHVKFESRNRRIREMFQRI